MYHAPEGQKALVLTGRINPLILQKKKQRKLISETVAPKSVVFSMACTMNDIACINAMKWFQGVAFIFFKRLLRYSKAIIGLFE